MSMITELIAMSNALSKLFESVVTSRFRGHQIGDECQFGFKPGHSAGICTRVLIVKADS